MQAITAPPPFATPEQHAQMTASTPTNFADIPPLLRWSDDAVSVEVLGGSLGPGRQQGSLWVTEALIAFLSSAGQGFSFPCHALILHAVTGATPNELAHLYCQVEASSKPPAAGDSEALNGHGERGSGDGEVDELEGDEDEYTSMVEIRIHVSEEKLSPLYEALANCSAITASNPSGGANGSAAGSSFPFLDALGGEDDDEDAWEDADEDDDATPADGDAEGGEAGRVRSDYHSGGGPGARFRPY